jgi:two-component system LytT family sensor kinase
VLGWSKLPDFWRFQLAGWAAFVVVTFPLKIELTGNVFGALVLCLARDGSSFLLTLALRLLYRAFWSDEGGRMAALIIAACTIVGFLQNGLFFLLREIITNEPEIFRMRSMAFNVFYERTGLLYGWSFLYFGMRQMLTGKQRQLELALAKSAQQGAEIQMLRAQMSPHFLFNALNMIQTEVQEINASLGRMIQSLADFLRFSLDHSQDELVPLGQEFDAALDYLQVEKMRLGDTLEFHCEIEDAARTVAVPGIILQPLAENAVKYGLDTSDVPLHVSVHVSQFGTKTLQITVSNTGRWLEPTPRHKAGHVGLQNLRRRLELLYPGKHHIEIIDRDGWVTITIRFPLYENPETRPDCG